MDNIHTEKYKGLSMNVILDESPDQNPNDWGDDQLFLVGFHDDFTVERDGYDIDVVRDDLKKSPKDFYVFGLEAYIHSGVSLALSQEGNFCDRQWDVSQLGAVYVHKNNATTRKKAHKVANSLINTWNDCMSGNVYGFEVLDERGEHLDSCWGFIGDYETSGIIEEARSIMRYEARKARKAKRAQEYKDRDIKEAKRLIEPYSLKIS